MNLIEERYAVKDYLPDKEKNLTLVRSSAAGRGRTWSVNPQTGHRLADKDDGLQKRSTGD